MLRKKTEKRHIKRIQKRRNKAIIQIALITLCLSTVAVGGACLISGRQTIVSPLPVLSMTTVSDPVSVVEYELKKQQITPQKVSAQGNSVVITLDKNQEVIVSTESDIAKQLASLQLITRQLTMEGKRFTRIDLRFDKPVISE